MEKAPFRAAPCSLRAWRVGEAQKCSLPLSAVEKPARASCLSLPGLGRARGCPQAAVPMQQVPWHCIYRLENLGFVQPQELGGLEESMRLGTLGGRIY